MSAVHSGLNNSVKKAERQINHTNFRGFRDTPDSGAAGDKEIVTPQRRTAVKS